MQTLDPEPGFVFLELPPEGETKKTDSGILMMATTDINPNAVGKVVNIGHIDRPVTYKSGDTVAYKKFSATPLALNGTDFVVVPADSIVGTIVEVSA